MRTEEKNDRTPLDQALDFYAEHVNVKARSKEFDLLERRLKHAIKALTEAEKAVRDLAETRLPILFFGRSFSEFSDSLAVAASRICKIPYSDISGRDGLNTDDLRRRIDDLNHAKRLCGGFCPKKDHPRDAIRLIYDTMCTMSEIIARHTGNKRVKVSHEDVAQAINNRFPDSKGGVSANAVGLALRRTKKGQANDKCGTLRSRKHSQ